MRDASLPDETVRRMLEETGVDPEEGVICRRRWPRFRTVGEVTFHRPHEKTRHAGTLVDISEGGLAFLTEASLAVGETVLLSYQEEGASLSAEGMVETVHSHPKETRYLVGVKFIREGSRGGPVDEK